MIGGQITVSSGGSQVASEDPDLLPQPRWPLRFAARSDAVAERSRNGRFRGEDRPRFVDADHRVFQCLDR